MAEQQRVMSQWFVRKRSRQLGQEAGAMPAGLLQYCPGGDEDDQGSFSSSSSLPNTGHDANKLSRPMHKDAPKAPEEIEKLFALPARHRAPDAHRNRQLRVSRSIWDRKSIDHEVALVGRTQTNLFQMKRTLALLLIATLVTVNYCCCLQADHSPIDVARESSHRAINNDGTSVAKYEAPAKAMDSMNAATTTTTTNGQQARPCPPATSKSEVMSASEKNSNAGPTASLDDSINKSLSQHALQHHLGKNSAATQSTQLVAGRTNGDLTLATAASGESLEPLVTSASKKKKKMMKKKKKMEKKHKEWKKGKKHKKKKYESKKKKGGSSKKKKGKKEKKKWGMEKKGHKKKGNFKKKKWGHKKKSKKGHKKGKKGHKMLKDKGHKKKGFKKVYHKEEWGKKKKWHDIKREKKWNTKQKKWKKKWHQEKGKKYKGKHMKKYHKKNKHGKKYKKEKKSKWKKHKGEKFKKGHKKKKEEYSKKKEGGKKKKMKKEMKKMKKKKG